MKGSIFGLGLLVLIIGGLMWIYPESYYIPFVGTLTYYPYRDYGTIACLVGVLIMVVGLAVSGEKRQQLRPSIPEKVRVCPKCSSVIPFEAEFCPKCGKKLEEVK